MLKNSTFIVDAFTTEKFAGNAAGVVLINKKLSDELYQKIATELNLSVTAFPLLLDKSDDFKKASKFSLRWFTPTMEIPLCGHATMGSSHVLFNEIENVNNAIYFECKSGDLVVKRSPTIPGAITMNFPQFTEIFDLISSDKDGVFPKAKCPDFIHDILKIVATKGIVHVALAPKAKILVIDMDPNMTKDEFLKIQAPKDALIQTHPEGDIIQGVVVTLAPKDPQKQGFVSQTGQNFDFVSRYFVPWIGIPEDAATGSSHCVLGPFWSKMLRKPGPFYAYQCYPGRGAEFHIELLPENRINLTGNATTLLRGNLDFDI